MSDVVVDSELLIWLVFLLESAADRFDAIADAAAPGSREFRDFRDFAESCQTASDVTGGVAGVIGARAAAALDKRCAFYVVDGGQWPSGATP